MDYGPDLQPGCFKNLFRRRSCSPFSSATQPKLSSLTVILHHLWGTGEADVCTHACAVETVWQWSRHKLKCESSLRPSLRHPLSPLICILRQVYQPSALMNECLSATALNLTQTLLCACVYLPVSPWLICSQKRSADVTAQRRTGRVTAGRRRPGRRGNKSVIFHPVHKQVIILRWAIAYYGLHPACDITKQRRTALCESLARANGECVLTSWHGLRGAWTSSAHGNPGRQCTCYDRVWEQTSVQHLSSCQLRHKLWIMNITEVMGLWDSFIALTNRISLEGWGAGIRQMTYFALQKKTTEPFNSVTCVSPLSHAAGATLLW